MSAMPKDDKKAIGALGRQEILTGLILVVFSGFIVIVAVILYLILSNPTLVGKIIVTGSVDVGKFIDQFQSMIPAFLTLLGVSVGAGMVSRIKRED